MHWFLIVLWAAAFQGILVFSVLIYKGWHKTSIGKSLLFLLSTVLLGLLLRLAFMPGIYSKYPQIVHSGDALLLVFGPAFWRFAQIVSYPLKKNRRRFHLGHFIPLLVFSIHFFVVLVPPDATDFFAAEASGDFDLYYAILLIGGIVMNVTYLLSSYRLLRQTAVSNAFSRILKRAVKINLGACALWGVALTLSFTYTDLVFLTNLSYQIAFVALSLNVFVVSITLMLNAEVLPKEAMPKYKTSPLSSPEIEGIRQKLISLLASEKPFLRHDLSLELLAKELDVNKVYLSRVINEAFDMNFSDLINQYRIEEFIARVRSGKYQNLTLFGIAADSGFNTKATFNKAFKKKKGMTPSQFFA